MKTEDIIREIMTKIKLTNLPLFREGVSSDTQADLQLLVVDKFGNVKGLLTTALSGGGGTLQSVTDAGNETTNSIKASSFNSGTAPFSFLDLSESGLILQPNPNKYASLFSSETDSEGVEFTNGDATSFYYDFYLNSNQIITVFDKLVLGTINNHTQTTFSENGFEIEVAHLIDNDNNNQVIFTTKEDKQVILFGKKVAGVITNYTINLLAPTITSSTSVTQKYSPVDGEIVVKKSIKVIPGTSYTLLPDDTYKILHFTSNIAVTVTIPNGLTAGLNFEGKQLGAGQLTFVGSGTTLRKGASENLKTAEQYSVFAVDWINTEEYMVYGKLELV